jgi:signal transduction histidine kinase
LADTKIQESSPSVDAVIEARQIEFVAANTLVDILSGPLWATAVALIFSGWIQELGTVPYATLFWWLAIVSTWSGIATFIRYRYRRDPAPEANTRWPSTYTWLYALNGAIWGSITWLFWIDGNAANNVMLIMVALATSISYGFQLTPHYRTYLATTLSLHLLLTARYIVDPTGIGTVFIFLGPAFAVWVLINGKESSRKLTESLKTQIENEKLAGHLSSMYEGLEAQVTIRTKQLERELHWRKDAQKQLQVAKDQAEAANKAKSAFLSSMSHELRTPLNAILGFGQLLEADPIVAEDPGRKTGVDQILRGGHHLLALITEVLDLSKIEEEKISLSLEIVKPEQAIQDCLSMVDASAKEANINLEDRTANVTFPPIYVDYTRLKQILINLLSNGIKYSGSGATVTLNAAETPQGQLKISVQDNGPGIAAELQKGIYQPFNRLGAESSDIEGTGIGLTIAKRLVEAMGGEITFESALGEGTTFWLTFPLHQPVDAIDAKEDNRSEKTAAIDTGAVLKQNVLYVEDNPTNIQLMRQMLGKVPSLSLATAQDAETAFKMIADKRPDVVIMDIHLPGMNGIEALGKLRGAAETVDLPVIALSAKAMPEDIKLGLDAGFRQYLTKPLVLPEVLSAIEDAVIS